MIDVNFDGLGMWWDLQEDGELIGLGITYQVTANVFTLTDDDERKFKRTKNLTHVTKLLPASHHDECELKCAVKKYSKENDVASELRRNADSDTYPLTLITADKPIFYIVPHEDNILELNNDTCAKSSHSSSTNLTTSNKHNDGKDIELTSTTREKMLTLIIGMAIDGFGYDPKEARSPLTGDNKNSLTARLQRLELKVSADTIRDYLTEAKQYLPPEKQ
jgi:hypothetical protein